MEPSSLLELNNVTKYYSIRRGFFDTRPKEFKVLHDVTLRLEYKKILGLVGESGSGKSTLARLIVGLEPVSSGQIFFKGKDISCLKDLRIRRQIQMVFQDPFSSLNPKKTIFQIISEPLKIHGLCPKSKIRDEVARLLVEAGLLPDAMDRYPHQFSGGQRQRIGLARALALDPELIVADEPTSALDVSIQAQIINLFLELHKKRGISFLFISHDLPLVEFVSDDVAVMYQGRIIEIMPRKSFLGKDRFVERHHPYTRLLFESVPLPDPSLSQKKDFKAEALEANIDLLWDNACVFEPRCRYKMDICRRKSPEMKEVGDNHYIACHLYN